jgi:predicted transcriptional regulator
MPPESDLSALSAAPLKIDMLDAVSALSALAQPTRLRAFQLIVRAEPAGLVAADLEQSLALPRNTVATHLGVLARAGLVADDRRDGVAKFRVQAALIDSLMLLLSGRTAGDTPARPRGEHAIAGPLAPSEA